MYVHDIELLGGAILTRIPIIVNKRIDANLVSFSLNTCIVVYQKNKSEINQSLKNDKIYKSLNIGICIPKYREIKVDKVLKKESDILYYFAKEPWKKYTFTELQKASKKKSKSYLSSVLKKFVAGKILKQESVGHLPVYSLNISSLKARIFLGFVLEYYGWNKKHIPYDDLQTIIDKIPYKNYIFIITGSYANGKQTEKSDIDIVVLIEDCCEPKRVYAELSQSCELNIPPVHLYVFKHSEFREMLCNKEANYGKEIVKNYLVLTEGQTYIKLIEEAIENGFDGKYIT